jgi:hypothetical protein
MQTRTEERQCQDAYSSLLQVLHSLVRYHYRDATYHGSCGSRQVFIIAQKLRLRTSIKSVLYTFALQRLEFSPVILQKSLSGRSHDELIQGAHPNSLASRSYLPLLLSTCHLPWARYRHAQAKLRGHSN